MDALFIGYISIIHSNQKLIRDDFQRLFWCTTTANTNYGCGLVIVERICERMSWPFELNDDGMRFTAKVDFYS